ncbi:Uncharacterised protein [Mycobacteroides abscessus subsp. abscessus]|uniref:hypothetical protein n=1 Tax=Mycobacteroides abscessus TaxID=36809 RepID=UPI0009A6BAF1|nr:hypothetical protein [Mycobacteroides abscessus]MBN7388526.1 hypothetical protein [Mycobacteroides abscessus subsp. abscessus]MBN7414796.1 hypothetical protein [Mycobacteroides abscessus subsp. abscessus]MDO2961054.1 hypothetical protein [Mycobacteroides abscessus subsp. abscessus]MDO2995022.1 hypothetical protein [Mycobacteroides abscessus subsp. abscessus]MDO3064325.1 hypothetical protein [Mycobacteroides abscessus subsp. abscessus]
MTDTTPATDAQKAYILKLAKCQHISDVVGITRVRLSGWNAAHGDFTRSEASAIIEDLLEQQGKNAHEYVAVEYRKWVDNKYASNGRTPSTARYFVSGDAYSSDIRDVLRKAGSLAEVLYRGRDEERAERVMRSHQGGYELAGAHGHERLLKHLAPQEDIDLLSDVTPAHLRAAVKRKSARTGYVFDALRRWRRCTSLRNTSRPDTLAVIAALASSLTRTTTGPEAQRLVDQALETVQVSA